MGMSNVLRKIIALLLAVCMVTLCACHVDKNDESSERESSSRTEESSQAGKAEVVLREGIAEDGAVVLTGENIVSAEVNAIKDETTGVIDYVISVSFDDEGTAAFAEVTERLAGEGQVSVWVDGECIFAPTVTSKIVDGNCQIAGGFSSFDEAKELADRINGRSGDKA